MSRLMIKPTKWHVRPAKTQITLGIRPCWLVFAVRVKKHWVLCYPLSAQRRHWSDWADAQADLSLHLVHSHFVGFVMRRLKWATSRENLSAGGCDQARHNPACSATETEILDLASIHYPCSEQQRRWSDSELICVFVVRI